MSRIVRFGRIAAALSLLVSAPLHAQDASAAPPLQTLLARGRLVRLHLYTGRTVRGKVAGGNDSTVFLADCRSCAYGSYRLIDIAGVDTAVGRSHQLRHAVTGALAGGFTLAGALAVAGTQSDRGCHDGPCGIWIVAVPPAFGLGALVGGVVGALLPSQRWSAASFTFRSQTLTPAA